jgi:serine/threonine-protein kinase
MRLLRSPPDDLPPDVQEDTEREELRLWVYAARGAAFIYAGFLVLCASIVWIGVRSWFGLAAIVVPLFLAFLIVSHAAWVRGRSETARILRIPALIAVATAIAGVSQLAGAMIVVPALAVAVAAGGGLWVRPGIQRWANLLANSGAIIIPFCLEWAGVLPKSYVFGENRVDVLPLVLAFREVPSRLSLAAATVGALVGATLFVYFATDMLHAMRLRLALQGWHLQQLAAVDDGKRLASSAPPSSDTPRSDQ